ncbi:MAG: hypothetical protein ACRDRS_23495 [Pseudonocardiaceae bacterium]
MTHCGPTCLMIPALKHLGDGTQLTYVTGPDSGGGLGFVGLGNDPHDGLIE